jgi:hypothetical protein
MKHQTPNSKLQSNSKHQAPTSNLQRSFKNQASKVAKSRRKAFQYPEISDGALSLNDAPMGDGVPKHPFDPEERTARFGEAIVRFSKKIPRDPTNNRLIDQLVGCGTSTGANYC